MPAATLPGMPSGQMSYDEPPTGGALDLAAPSLMDTVGNMPPEHYNILKQSFAGNPAAMQGYTTAAGAMLPGGTRGQAGMFQQDPIANPPQYNAQGQRTAGALPQRPHFTQPPATLPGTGPNLLAQAATHDPLVAPRGSQQYFAAHPDERLGWLNEASTAMNNANTPQALGQAASQFGPSFNRFGTSLPYGGVTAPPMSQNDQIAAHNLASTPWQPAAGLPQQDTTGPWGSPLQPPAQTPEQIAAGEKNLAAWATAHGGMRQLPGVNGQPGAWTPSGGPGAPSTTPGLPGMSQSRAGNIDNANQRWHDQQAQGDARMAAVHMGLPGAVARQLVASGPQAFDQFLARHTGNQEVDRQGQVMGARANMLSGLLSEAAKANMPPDQLAAALPGWIASAKQVLPDAEQHGRTAWGTPPGKTLPGVGATNPAAVMQNPGTLPTTKPPPPADGQTPEQTTAIADDTARKDKERQQQFATEIDNIVPHPGQGSHTMLTDDNGIAKLEAVYKKYQTNLSPEQAHAAAVQAWNKAKAARQNWVDSQPQHGGLAAAYGH